MLQLERSSLECRKTETEVIKIRTKVDITKTQLISFFLIQTIFSEGEETSVASLLYENGRICGHGGHGGITIFFLANCRA